MKNKSFVFLFLIVAALFAFEIFNFSVTKYALVDILGNLTLGTLRWSTVLACAFCGIDFVGVARIFTPETSRDEPSKIWFLFAAWFLAAAFNAILIWWGIGLALIGAGISTPILPVFFAALVLLIRVLLINTISLAS